MSLLPSTFSSAPSSSGLQSLFQPHLSKPHGYHSTDHTGIALNELALVSMDVSLGRRHIVQSHLLFARHWASCPERYWTPTHVHMLLNDECLVWINRCVFLMQFISSQETGHARGTRIHPQSNVISTLCINLNDKALELLS